MLPPVRWELTDGELRCVGCRICWEPGSRAEFEFAFAIVLPARVETVEDEEE